MFGIVVMAELVVNESGTGDSGCNVSLCKLFCWIMDVNAVEVTQCLLVLVQDWSVLW